MNETPVVPDPTLELPVPDPRAFFLYRENHLFLTGQRATPVTTPQNTDGEVALTLLGMVGVLGGVAVVAGADGNGGGVMMGIFILFLSLAVGMYALQSNSSEGLSLKEQVLEGMVVESEKIRTRWGSGITESIGVRYTFTTPDGIKRHHCAEAASDGATVKVSPALGTPVYIWSDGEGEYFLL